MVIELVPYDPRWADIYQGVAAEIQDALGEAALRIDHVGSTAIPDIVAKPVIDVLVLVERYDPEAPYRGPLESRGYAFDHRDETHVFFKGSHGGMRVNVHVVEASSESARPMVAFRDHLRMHPEDSSRYEGLKKALAKDHSDENEYAAAKSDFVEEIARKAAASTSLGPITPRERPG